MLTEAQAIAVAVLFGLFQLVFVSGVRTRAYGTEWNMGARDKTPLERRTALIGRLERAQRNFEESFPLFAAAALAVMVLGRSGELTRLAATAYVVARLLYVPLYAAGVPVIRSLVWAAGALAVLVLAGAALGIV